MHDLQIAKPNGQEGEFFLPDGTPYYGPTHIGANMQRFTGQMPSPEALPVLTGEQLMMKRYQELMIDSSEAGARGGLMGGATVPRFGGGNSIGGDGGSGSNTGGGISGG